LFFRVHNVLNRESFVDLSDHLQKNVDEIFNTNNIEVDLSDIRFSEPAGIVGLIIFTRFLYNEYGIKSIIKMPNNVEAHKYLLNAGITKDKGVITEFENINNSMYLQTILNKLGIAGNKTTSVNFIAVTDIVSEEDIKNVNKKFEDWMVDNNYSEEEKNDLQVLVSELCQNISQHSETVQNGVFLMQGYTYKSLGDEKRCIISIGDTGIGIKGSLDKKKKINEAARWEDDYTIRMVLKNGLSSKEDDQFRGNGFFNLQRLAKKHNLNFYIHSHGGLFYCEYSESKLSKKIQQTIYPIKGTQVSFELRTKKHK
jgi:anti-sigma regulatory factor (Ser/Thr protein kinase)